MACNKEYSNIPSNIQHFKGIIALYLHYFSTNVVPICIFALCVFTVLYGVFDRILDRPVEFYCCSTVY